METVRPMKPAPRKHLTPLLPAKRRNPAQRRNPQNPQSPQKNLPQPETEGEEGGTLVVYYSATGNTEQVANYIADITGGDLFELEPADPYTDEDLNYNNEGSRVLRNMRMSLCGM